MRKNIVKILTTKSNILETRKPIWGNYGATDSELPKMSTHTVGLKRKILQPALMVVAVLTGLSMVMASLRKRPDIKPPEGVSDAYLADRFQHSLDQANADLEAMAASAGMPTAERAANLTVARRISLALVGSGLSLEEVRALSLVPENEQIRWWTSYLLADRRWADYFAERFSRAFVGTNDGPFLLFRRRKFRLWLAEQLLEGTGYDRIVHSMISAEGLWTDTPQVNFVTATVNEGNRGDPVLLAGRTARAFLAQRVDCVQCHDDFLGELNFGTDEDPIDGTQEHFHSLAAFYSGTGFPDPVFQGIREDGQEYLYKFLGEDEERQVAPAVPFANDLLPTQGKPRERLAAWVTHPDNRAFARATTNRVWALLFSRPLVGPVDNIPLDESVPKVLDTLAGDFASNGFDLRRLIRLMVETDAFQRDSRARFEVTEEHEACWAVFPITQLRPEQVAGSMFQAGKLTAIDASSSIFTRLKSFGDQQDFLKRFGDRGEDEFHSEAVTISQRLVMMNGNLVTERTKVDLINNASSRIAAMVGDNFRAIELVYLCALNRMPTEIEAAEFERYLDGKKGNARSRAIGDIFWAMTNSTEFSWNH